MPRLAMTGICLLWATVCSVSASNPYHPVAAGTPPEQSLPTPPLTVGPRSSPVNTPMVAPAISASPSVCSGGCSPRLLERSCREKLVDWLCFRRSEIHDPCDPPAYIPPLHEFFPCAGSPIPPPMPNPPKHRHKDCCGPTSCGSSGPCSAASAAMPANVVKTSAPMSTTPPLPPATSKREAGPYHPSTNGLSTAQHGLTLKFTRTPIQPVAGRE